MLKCRFVVCPPIPKNVKAVGFEHFKRTSGSHDWRSTASEQFAFDYIGIKHVLVEEDVLIHKYACQGVRVPECIALDPDDPDRIISIEVKRICGNQLPLDFTGQVRRKLKHRNEIVWPWSKTIHASIEKAHPKIVSDMGVQRHHIVFVVPSSLTPRSLQRLCTRIQTSVSRSLDEFSNSEYLMRHYIVHIIQGDDILFDRF